MQWKRILRTLTLLLVLLSTASVQGGQWFVATNGSDAHAGTAAAPFATITRAVTATQPGDVVNVRGGIYRQRVVISSRGTSAAQIVVRSAPGEQAVIDGGGQPPNTPLVNITDVAWVQFVGFEVRASTGIGIVVWGSANTTISFNDVHDCAGSGIWVGDDQRGPSTHITITRNRVHGNVASNAPHLLKSGWAQAIGVLKSDEVAVVHNWIFRNDGEGIAFVLSSHCSARENEVFDNYAVEIYLDNAQRSSVDANFIYSSNATRFYRGGQPAFGIAVANEKYDLSMPSAHLTITNNIVVRSRSGFYYGNYERGGGLRDTLVAHNTFVSAGEELLRIEEARHRATTFVNNIFVQPSGSIANVEGSGLTFRSNHWSTPRLGAAAGRGDVIGDPRLASARGWSADNFRLLPGSPCIGTGTPVNVATDFFGHKRGGKRDLGAISSR